MALISLFKKKDINALKAKDFYTILIKDLVLDFKTVTKDELNTISLESLQDFQYQKFYKLLENNGIGKYLDRDFVQTTCILIALKEREFSFKRSNWQKEAMKIISAVLPPLNSEVVNKVIKRDYELRKYSSAYDIPLSKMSKVVRTELYRFIISELTRLK